MPRIFLILLAALAAGAAGWVALQPPRSSGRAMIVAEAQVGHREVLVAAADLQSGAELKADSMRWQKWPENGVNASFITRDAKPDALERFAGLVVRSRISLNEPIQEDRLGSKGSSLLSARLGPGMRAVAVRITAANTAGGFVLPNDRVDVLHTVPDGPRKFATRRILENIVVLAIDQVLDVEAGKGRTAPSSVGRTATLEVAPEQGELLVAAEASGQLSLALRSVVENPTQVQQSEPAFRTIRVLRNGQTETIKVPTGPST